MEEIKEFITKDNLINALKEFGIKEGMSLMVHSKMSSFAYVVGGSQTIVDALIETVGYQGTIIMPMHSSEFSEPGFFENPPISVELHEKYRENLPSYDKKLSDSFAMSKIYETFLKKEGVISSNHPQVSFLAYGHYAKEICSSHPLAFMLGEKSPNQKLYDLKAYCLLMGVDYENATCLHLAEYKSQIRPIIMQGTKIDNKWVKFLDYDIDSEDFNLIGERLEKKGLVRTKEFAKIKMKLFRIDQMIDEGIQYYRERL